MGDLQAAVPRTIEVVVQQDDSEAAANEWLIPI
jgi:hypothetical protein